MDGDNENQFRDLEQEVREIHRILRELNGGKPILCYHKNLSVTIPPHVCKGEFIDEKREIKSIVYCRCRRRFTS